MCVEPTRFANGRTTASEWLPIVLIQDLGPRPGPGPRNLFLLPWPFPVTAVALEFWGSPLGRRQARRSEHCFFVVQQICVRVSQLCCNFAASFLEWAVSCEP